MTLQPMARRQRPECRPVRLAPVAMGRRVIQTPLSIFCMENH
jgi:hypothetical protein